MQKVQDKPVGWYLKPESIQKEVTFQTEDGWTIHGTYTIPKNHKPGQKLPAAFLLHASMHSQTVWVAYPGWAKIQESIATLRIDWRGRGKSREPIAFVDASRAQREKLLLDVQAGLNFLAAQEEVDPKRLGVVAEELTASAAVIGSLEDPRVRVMVLLSGLLNETAMDFISANTSKPILYVVSKEDQKSFADMTAAYNATESHGSDIWVQDGLGVGATMGSVWRNVFADQPMDKSIDDLVGQWLVAELRKLGTEKEVTIKTADGWTLYATLLMPDVEEGQTVPGVVLLPTALVDRDSYHSLERTLVRHNIAVLDLEWRGIGKSVEKGNYVDMTLSELLESPRDVQEGFKFLATQKGVDPERIGVLGTALAAKLAMHAAKENPKFKAVAMLTPVVWPWEEKNDYETVDALGRPVLFVTGDGFGEMTKNFAAHLAKNKLNHVITFPGGVFGYLLTRLDKDFDVIVSRWFSDHLNGK
jgi:dipeptidyl aminopeptidase/acylaminoacyl peptidase